MENKITICLGKSCLSNFSKDVLKQAEKILKCRPEERSKDDSSIFLETVHCMKNCKNGPSVRCNNFLFSKTSPRDIKKIIACLKKYPIQYKRSIFEKAKKVS